MKIGILTFHNAVNYGALLQAYALQQVLSSMGHDVEFIDYRNSSIERRARCFDLKFNSILQVFKNVIFHYKPLSKRIRFFREFREKYLTISGRILPEILKDSDYEMIVVGSDQVWNPILTNGIDSVYWGEYSGNIPTISYAASSNDPNTFSSENIDIIGRYISNFSALGVRENRLRDFFYDKYGANSSVVLDPTLLAGKKYFENIIGEKIFNDPYVLVYSVEMQTSQLKGIVHKIAQEKGLKIIVIGGNSRNWRGAKFIQPSIPQFLSLIKHAECVVSLSFHGTAFSIIYEKDFYSVKGGNMARVETLLSSLGLMDRIISDELDVNYSQIDYNSINITLSELQEYSRSFLIKEIYGHNY